MHFLRSDQNPRLVFGLALATLVLSGALLILVPKFFLKGSPSPPAANNPELLSNVELPRLEVFLNFHPIIEARLLENPALVSDPAFQKNHPLWAQLIERHPELIAKLAAKPRWFIHRELVRLSATHAQVDELDRFLDRHGEIEKLLIQHPQLLQQPEFLHNHLDLEDFLMKRPGITRAPVPKP